MNENLYTILLEFDPDDHPLRKKIIQRLSQIDPTASERLKNIKHGRVTVKKNASLTTAQRLVRTLQKTGAICKIQKQPLAKYPTPSQDVVSIAALKSSQESIKCPNCKREQTPAIECRTCGVIFEKAGRHQKKILQNKAVKPIAPSKPVQSMAPEKLKRQIVRVLSIWIKKRPFNSENLQNWWQRLADRLLSCGIVFIVALALETGLLFICKMLWHLYVATEVGKYYVAQFPEKAGAIQGLITMDLLLLSWDSTLMVLYVSLLLSIIAQLLHLIRYFFDTQGLIGKVVIWCAPSAALAAWGVLRQYHLPDYLPAVGLVLVPTLCILFSCMQMARDTIPEVGTLWNIVVNAFLKGDNRSWTQFKHKLRMWIDARL